ncbi:MerC domain-containing protein [Silanimonas sp.]|uniref:MerC domain-containing protein n=1 Tax=Silanimonas sp. TaxID=1929290 RepID=UPI001BB8F323|nr:MerC domain-containing protein [Silanimonas sp.]MBS3895688.1 MerC domain-containing protein [Silanimonas sp.]MBS3924393.1 MerC domain-containing protein [Xanthomonadaceae bacterium]
MRHPIHRPAVELRGRWYDRLGISAATLCVIHCATLPLTIGLLPALGLSVLASHGFELVFLGMSTTFAVLSVAHSLRFHGRFHAWGLLLLGLGILYGERLVPAIHEQPVPHAIVMSLGGLLVAVAHAVNLRRAHADCACPNAPAEAAGPAN